MKQAQSEWKITPAAGSLAATAWASASATNSVQVIGQGEPDDAAGGDVDHGG